MDKNIDYNGFNSFYGCPPYDNFDASISDINFNPIIQYEQSYMYYRYLTQAVEYKIKCKEYEKLTSKEGRPERRVD